MADDFRCLIGLTTNKQFHWIEKRLSSELMSGLSDEVRQAYTGVLLKWWFDIRNKKLTQKRARSRPFPKSVV